MLKNDFYTVRENKSGASEHEFCSVIELNVNHTIYKGHFPEMPVVPGVCQVQIIKELLEEKIGKPLRMITGDNIKFTGMIIPTQNAVINIDMSYQDKEDNVIGAEAKLFFGNTIFTKFKGTFKPQ